MTPTHISDLTHLIDSNHADVLADVKQALAGFDFIDNEIAQGCFICLVAAMMRITHPDCLVEARRNLLHDIIGNAMALLVVDQLERGTATINRETRERAASIAKILVDVQRERIARADA